MDQRPSYTFSFIQANGTRQTRAIFYENLYVFSQGSHRLLAAARVVPHQDLLFATYLALKKSHHRTSNNPLLGADTRPQLHAQALVDQSVANLPTPATMLPPTITTQVENLLDQSVDRIMLEQGIAPYLEPKPTLGAPPSLQERFDPPGAHILADFNGEDVGWVQLGNTAHYHLQQQANDWARQTLGLIDGRPLPALQRELEDELSRALYSNPQYLKLVKYVVQARGGFASSLVRHFTLFCLKELKKALRQDDELFWRQRLESHIGRAATRGPNLLPHYHITILGLIQNEPPAADPHDPQRTPHSYRAEAQPADLDLAEITSPLRKPFFKALVRAYFRQPIAQIGFVDELEDTASNQLPDYLAA
ncbi:MAG: hypothetical protein GKR89_32835 [Candidatus Latescibacteria bacterium]|nr:hypothetical protein [Candidatus Latescibacterota bacterium]